LPGKKKLPPAFKKLLKGCNAIEPIIGHLKQDHRLSRNFLLGTIGDKVNALLAGSGFNLRKILNCINDGQVAMV
jgi:IS5 family transposase